jgi:protein FRA10AC1
MELPFSYVEQGETSPREAMVKVVLCERCVKKLMWKREKEKKDRKDVSLEDNEQMLQEEGPGNWGAVNPIREASRGYKPGDRFHNFHNDQRDRGKDRSRSRSPRRKQPSRGS